MRSKAGEVGKGGKDVPHARERARLLKVQRERQEARRRLLIRVGIPLLVVAAVIAVMVVVRVAQQPEPTSAGSSGPADATVTQALTSIPASTFDAVGVGTVLAAPTAITGPALTADGTSAGADVYPGTAALSFHGATYSSDLLSFTGVETTSNVRSGNGYEPLDTLTAADQALVTQYNSTGSIPFMDMGNRFVFSGASYDPSVLKGLDQEQIATALADPSTPVAQAVNGAANVMTAALCTLTSSQPVDVCTSAGVLAGAAKLPG